MSDGPKMLAALSTTKAATDHHKIGAAFSLLLKHDCICQRRHNILTLMRQDKSLRR
ncbi:hypothetical protein ACHMW7_21945 [Aminobacter sp. UC22_36]|uniref:hypothetical protein n=1 Tax=Aminobacter sp. UC22_36 TaxID=3374549 RepID=UPI00375768D2